MNKNKYSFYDWAVWRESKNNILEVNKIYKFQINSWSLHYQTQKMYIKSIIEHNKIAYYITGNDFLLTTKEEWFASLSAEDKYTAIWEMHD